MMKGFMFVYDLEHRLPAFMTGNVETSNYIIFIAGLTDTFLSVGYLPLLQQSLEGRYNIVSVLTRSSGHGFGTGTLQRDAEDIEKMVDYLYHKQGQNNQLKIILLGFSTGCNDIVWYLKHYSKHKEIIRAIILQGPVSDREYLRTLPNNEELLSLAYDMIVNNMGDELMPRNNNMMRIPITAERFFSLAGERTSEDLFSTDLTENEFINKLGHIDIPTLIVYSLKDEYIPDNIKHKIPTTAEIMKKIIGKNSNICDILLLEEANHAIDNNETSINIFVKKCVEFLDQL